MWRVVVDLHNLGPAVKPRDDRFFSFQMMFKVPVIPAQALYFICMHLGPAVKPRDDMGF